MNLIKIPLYGLLVALKKKKTIIKNKKLITIDNYIGSFIFIKILIFFLIINKMITCEYFNKDSYIFLVLLIISELINTAIELLANYIQPKYDIKIGDIKDLSASICFAVKGFFIFYVYFYGKNKCVNQ